MRGPGRDCRGETLFNPRYIDHAVNGSAVDGLEGLRQKLDSISDSTPIVLQVERAGMLPDMALAGPAYPAVLPKASRFTTESMSSSGISAPALRW